MTNVSSWTNTTLPPIHNLLASPVPCIAHFHLENRCELCRASVSRDMIRPIPHKPYYILPRKSHHTYLSWHFHSHFEIYCHATSMITSTCHVCSSSYCFAWSYRADMIFVAKPMFIIVIHVTLDHCTSWYTARGIHIESYCFSYRVVISSCK